jgi:DNA polymerase family B, exonuclease domain
MKRLLAEEDDAMQTPLKRIRGGGVDGEPPDEDYYLDEEADMEEIDIPEEIDSPPDNSDQIVFSDISEDMRKRWLRPTNAITDNGNDVSLQWFDMDVVGGSPLAKNPNESKEKIVGATTGQVPIIRAYGVTESGNSVALFIHGFTPYGYFALPANATFENTEKNLAKIRHCINNRLEGAVRGSNQSEYCRAVSYFTCLKSIMGFDTRHTHFFKVMLAMPTMVPTLKRIMEDGIELPGVTAAGDNFYQAFECNVPFVLRYMIDMDISGAGWLTLPKRTYSIRPGSKKQTHCQVKHPSIEFSSQSMLFDVSYMHPPYVLARPKSTLHTLILLFASQKANGAKSHRFEFFLVILSARDAKVTSPKLKKTQSYKSPMY